MLAGAGTQFTTTGNARASTQFTPYGQTTTQSRSIYGPLRQPQQNPAVARSPPPSPTCTRLDPTARSFTPKQSPSRFLRVDTNVQQEPATLSPTPRTPRIEVSPAEDQAVHDAAFRAARQRSRTRRQSSPGRPPMATRAQSGYFGWKTTMLPLASPVPVSRTFPSPGSRARGPMTGAAPAYVPPNTTQTVDNPFLAPTQPMNPAAWLAETHNVGYEHHLRGLQTMPGLSNTSAPTAPQSAPGRARAPSVSSRPLICSAPECRHRAQGKTFKTLSELRKHERTHLPETERPHACRVPGCPRKFFWPKDLKRHVEVYHEKAKVRCEHCGTELCRQDDLARHIATVHKQQAASPRNWAAPSPSASSAASLAMTPRSERSFVVPSTPPTGSSSRPKMSHLTSFDSIAEDEDDGAYSVPMVKSFTR